ncbi:nucleoside-diphosphate sugar epimerase/dehydratase [Peribacillus frigoritolerans]|uniref:polysaccharide biosynthesis protein n=1 Tax=Peribacillus frigoritolerans TaxID=450367 RepID=UPI002B254475|nr:nucleoside-diphosphate sugar epimerase/dehydratase [Peribacillus frigoritolerans]MEB2628694.1 nucleoside-diphosphate sugar epimerase/dehydratase [Peribacillus frigoritolerans]
MTYYNRLFTLVFLDALVVVTAVFLSYWLIHPYDEIPAFTMLITLILLVCHYFFTAYLKQYKKAWEYASIKEMFNIFKLTAFSITITAAFQLYFTHFLYSRELFITCILYMTMIGCSRLAWRIYFERYIKQSPNKKRTLVVGAGSAGTMITSRLLKSSNIDLVPVAFVDDDKAKLSLEIFNIPIVAVTKHISQVVEQYKIEHIVIAIPSLKREEINTILSECIKACKKTQIVPSLEAIVQGGVPINELQDIQMEDLLGRLPVQLDDEGISEKIVDSTILVTGAGGSIGSEICRQIMKYNPAKIVLLGHGENSIYAIELELREVYADTIEIVTEIADIQDRRRMFQVIDLHRPNIVYHAAAHKHVPLMESNPKEAVKNNMIGTMNVAEASEAGMVDIFVMVSSDKAVNPTSIMGASKCLAEMMIQSKSLSSHTKFVTVRFGNVLGSNGSVIPLFKKQIKKGGPLTVTHPDMIRYFMTIPEASRLVIQAGVLAKGGEVFVLDMGEPVKIVDFAKKLIQLSGYTVEDIGITFTGIRPGEKLYEELLGEDEVYLNQIYPQIHIGKPREVNWSAIKDIITTYDVLSEETLKDRMLKLANYRERNEIPIP